eukprot:1176670-Karenia_brevis.AAC.1
MENDVVLLAGKGCIADPNGVRSDALSPEISVTNNSAEMLSMVHGVEAIQYVVEKLKVKACHAFVAYDSDFCASVVMGRSQLKLQ